MNLKDKLGNRGWVFIGLVATVGLGVGGYLAYRVGIIRSAEHSHEPIPDIGVYVAGLDRWQRRDLRRALRGKKAPGHVQRWLASQDKSVLRRLEHVLGVS